MPARVRRDSGIATERDEAEVCGRELPAARVACWVAPGAELLEVRPVADVDLGRQVAQDRSLEGLVRAERAARQRPRVAERLAGALPQEDVEHAVSHLEDDCQRDVRGNGGWGGRLSHEVIDSEAKTSMSGENGTRRQEELDLVVVGGGVAGLFAALCAAAEGDVLVLTKGPLLWTSSLLAQGGIAAAVGGDDSPALHAEDTVRTGRGLCRRSAVTVLTEEAPARIRDLVELGVEFDEGQALPRSVP